MSVRKKRKINVLLNIDNFFGEHRGRLGPMITFLLVSAAPFIAYVFFFSSLIPLTWVLVFEVLFTARMALLILGDENKKLQLYLKGRQDEYASANDLVRITNIQDDGLVEYTDGTVCYILKCFISSFVDESDMTSRFKQFISLLSKFDYDIHGQLVVDEFYLSDMTENMNVYVDKDLMKERLGIYKEQDEYCSKNSKLYRIIFVVRSSKYNWKVLKETLSRAVNSTYAKVFKHCEIADHDSVIDIMSRDICAYVDIQSMLQNKYSNDEYYGSKVLFYGDDIPDEYKEKKEEVGMEKRRVTE